MKLAEMTWKDVNTVDRETVVLIPTGSVEQHGPALPLDTDTRIVTAIAEGVESRLSDRVLLLPTVWLGLSAQHLAFSGSLTATAESYQSTLEACIRSLMPSGFWKFYVLNGHGGNTHANGLLLRKLKTECPNLSLCHVEYWNLIADEIGTILTGPDKQMTHASEAEASLVMHLAPSLVRNELLRNDGMNPWPPLKGLVSDFDEITEEGSFGCAKEATAEKGGALFEAVVAKVAEQIEVLAAGFVYTSVKE